MIRSYKYFLAHSTTKFTTLTEEFVRERGVFSY